MEQIKTIAIAGAGTMGAGIAQVSAQAGFNTLLFDVAPSQIELAKQNIVKNLDKAIAKGTLTPDEASSILSRLNYTNNLDEIKADLVIEAVVEKIEVKQALFRQLAANNAPETILASNTSSFSITRIAAGIPNPERVVGMHFFNPATLMKLVEVINGTETSPETIAIVKSVAEAMGKQVVLVADSPGFIVNRVARHYYLESLKVLEEQVAPFETIDDLMEATGFKMGPFRLQDMIGIDINYTVTESMFQAFHFEPRFRPSRIQQLKKEAGHLGKKTGMGYYKY